MKAAIDNDFTLGVTTFTCRLITAVTAVVIAITAPLLEDAVAIVTTEK